MPKYNPLKRDPEIEDQKMTKNELTKERKEKKYHSSTDDYLDRLSKTNDPKLVGYASKKKAELAEAKRVFEKFEKDSKFREALTIHRNKVLMGAFCFDAIPVNKKLSFRDYVGKKGMEKTEVMPEDAVKNPYYMEGSAQHFVGQAEDLHVRVNILENIGEIFSEEVDIRKEIERLLSDDTKWADSKNLEPAVFSLNDDRVVVAKKLLKFNDTGKNKEYQVYCGIIDFMGIGIQNTLGRVLRDNIAEIMSKEKFNPTQASYKESLEEELKSVKNQVKL